MLDLGDLGNSAIPGVTPALGSALSEAAAICLDSKGHRPGGRLAVRGIFNRIYTLNWQPAAEQAHRIWQYNRATEWGAEGIAVLLAESETPHTVIEAGIQLTGIDYWLGDASDNMFQRKARLEVSGIRQRGGGAVSDSIIAQRVNDKLRQTNQSDDTQLPAYVIVVEFGRPVAEVHRNERDDRIPSPSS